MAKEPEKKASKKKSKGKPATPPVEAPLERGRPFPIVGVGASAGGLEAFKQFIKEVPADIGMGFVLVQHLDPKHQSFLTQILSKATVLPVREVKKGMPVEPNHVYVIPPNTNMIISGGVLQLLPRSEVRGQHMPIDCFLRSLAQDQGSRAIGVILSGSASDGVLGLKAIKAEGGITFVQDEKSAKYDGMPRSAIAAGCVDFVLPPHRIAKELARLGTHPYVTPVKPLEHGELVPEGSQLGQVIRLLGAVTGVDFTYYKQPTIKRRIARRMALKKVDSLAHYIAYLKDDPEEVQALCQDILIHVTGFFRDPQLFQILSRRILPKVLKKHEPPAPLRIWVPGCSTGEEVYSLAICVLEAAGPRMPKLSIQIFATDVNETAIEKARSGIYPQTIAADVSAERLRRFFVHTEAGYQISKPVRDLCVFAKQDLTRDPPFSNLDLISCRNLMIYLGPVLQRQIVGFFHYALKPGGILVLGSSESLSGFSDLFTPVDSKHRIFARKAAPARVPIAAFSSDPVAVLGTESNRQTWSAADLKKRCDEIILAKYAPAAIVVDPLLRIVQFRGHTSAFLEPASGEASLGVLRMVREDLAPKLRAALQRAQKAGSTARKTRVLVERDSQFREVNLEVIPMTVPPSKEKYFLILFEDSAGAQRVRERGSSGARETPKGVELVTLRRELESTREYLQSVIESQEATNAELRSAYEEIQSSNEELQSTNEELETAKEELQSTNEELTTVNETLQSRNVELGEVNNDLNNLLGGVNLAIVMLDNDLRIRRFTPLASRVLNLIPTDLGRRISDLRPNIDVPDLEDLLLDTLKNLRIQEREVLDGEGRWYSLRVRPYRTAENRIEGVVLLLVDIHEMKVIMQKLEWSLDYAQAIVETVRQPLLVLDPDLRVWKANRRFYQTFLLSPQNVENRFFYELDPLRNIPSLRSLLHEVSATDKPFENFEVSLRLGESEPRTMLLYGRRLSGGHELAPRILLGMEDVTERRETVEIRYQRFFEAAKDGILIADADSGRIMAVNPYLDDLLGYNPAELLGKPLWELLAPEDLGFHKEAFDDLRSKEYARIDLVRVQASDGRVIEMEMVCSAYWEANRKVIQCNLRDVSERVRAEQEIRASLREKEVLLKEVHHRVKNNLQIIHSLLNLQAAHIHDPRALNLYKESQNRIRSMALIHEELYRSKSLSVIDFSEYVRKLVTNLVRSLEVNPGSVQIRTDIDNALLNIDTAIPCGMIVNELVSNALKHAFPEDRQGEIRIELHPLEESQYRLVVADTGVGFPKSIDFHSTESLGLQLVRILSEQLGGSIELLTAGGTEFRLTFKEVEAPSRIQ